MFVGRQIKTHLQLKLYHYAKRVQFIKYNVEMITLSIGHCSLMESGFRCFRGIRKRESLRAGGPEGEQVDGEI